MRLPLTAVLLTASLASAQAPTLRSYFTQPGPVQSGGVKLVSITTPRGVFKVWTKRFGNNPKMRVLLLHGGPGGTHEYFEAMEGFLPPEGIEFIYYDQLGSGNSDQPKDSDLWTTERFVEEVEQVRLALGLDKDNFYLLGHSWGGILAAEYALKYGAHLKGLIISNMMMSIPLYVKYADEVLAKQMKPEVVKEIKALEASNRYDSPRYMELLIPNFYNQHICRLKEWPEPVSRSLSKINRDIYVLMQGPSEFSASGRLEKWDRTADLKRLAMPTLVIAGTHDTMDPAHMKWVSEAVQQGSYLLCPEGSHLSMWDDQAHYFPGLVKFLKQVDAGKKKVTFP